MLARPSDTPPAHRGRSLSIELELRDVGRLFNPLDPSPLGERDLSPDAEEFIVSSAEEHPPDAPLTLRIHLQEWPDEDPSELIRAAVRHYFSYRAGVNHLEFRRLMKRGRTSLIIGSLFLALCLLLSTAVTGSGGSPWTGIVQESLTIAGWVAMWRPMEVYLYDWWPLRRRGRV